MSGKTSTPIFDKDGQYLSYTADATITLGQVVKLTSTGVAVGTVASGSPTNLGVAIGSNKFSRTATDDEIAAGSKVTVCTRGIVRVLTGSSAILVGSYVESGAAGIVDLLGTTGATDSVEDAIGIALEANSSAEATIKIKLLRG